MTMSLVQGRRFPARDGLGGLHHMLPYLHHDPRFGTDLPMHATQWLVQHQTRSHFGMCSGSASSWATLSQGRAISIETVYFMGESSGLF